MALTLAVVYPEAGNIGGGGFMLIRFKDGKTRAIDYREMAPQAADRNIFLNEKGELIDGEGGSEIGYRASGVPGTPAGLDMAFQKFSSKKLAWRELVEPARRLALDGYVLSHRLAELFEAYSESLSKYEDSRKIFLNGGKYFNEGDILRQPELAATLARMQRFGAREFYTGQTAKLIAADMKRHNGLITADDLKNYRAVEREPLRGTYRGHEIISMPPPSSGGIVMLQILNTLERYDLAKFGHNSAQKYHVYAEASRRAFADRAVHMGDPDFAKVPDGAAHRQELRAEARRNHQSHASIQKFGDRGRRGDLFRRNGHDAFHGRRRRRQRRHEHLYHQRSLRFGGNDQGDRGFDERRNGRLRGASGKTEYVRFDTG
ncbi:MAG: gamma-glutamyltransferase [Acidobacteria bacterium]|nr:gamma-glutamyltransferase [Acidobacteriota bacterium]